MLNPVSLAPSAYPATRHAARLLTMVHELHKAGYQRICFSAGMAPSGCHWRCFITHAGNMTVNPWNRRVARHIYHRCAILSAG